jgi:hypothetical protein
MQDEKRSNSAMLRYASLATQWLVMLAIAVWGGMKLDEWLHFKALFVIILPLISLVFSLWQLIRSLK